MDTGVHVYGKNTYTHREKLRESGGSWDSKLEHWIFNNDKFSVLLSDPEFIWTRQNTSSNSPKAGGLKIRLKVIPP